MAGSLDKFAEIPNNYKYIGLMAFIAILGGVFWYFVYDPSMQQIKRLKNERKEKSAKVAEAEEIVKNYDKFKQEKEKVEAELNEALKKLPKGREIPSLLEKINESVITAGLNISTFQPGALSDKGLYSEFPINITMTGGYHEFARFTDTVSKLDRIVTIGTINMTPIKTPTGEDSLSIVAQATTYTSK
jgi:type IV pilus assembly protein PilO